MSASASDASSAPRPPIVRSSQPICVRVNQAMRLLDIGKTKLYELLASGDLEAIRIGRRTLVLQESIDELVDRLRAGASKRDY